jgi:hypothetical protein
MISKRMIVSICAVLAYIGMISVNALANILPINNVTTGGVSDSYPNLFAPAGITFSIWGVIYLLLAGHAVFQLVERNNGKHQPFLEKVNRYFLLSSVINIMWIFAWHYRYIGISVLLMIALLFSLIRIADLINAEKITLREKLFVKVPFGVYFGWITIATIANIAASLVSVGWNGFGFTDVFWMIVVLIVGVLISGWRMIKDSSIAYGLVPVWAYFGIFLKHTSEAGFNGSYPLVITVVQFCLAVLLLADGYLVLQKRLL